MDTWCLISHWEFQSMGANHLLFNPCYQRNRWAIRPFLNWWVQFHLFITLTTTLWPFKVFHGCWCTLSEASFDTLTLASACRKRTFSGWDGKDNTSADYLPNTLRFYQIWATAYQCHISKVAWVIFYFHEKHNLVIFDQWKGLSIFLCNST